MERFNHALSRLDLAIEDVLAATDETLGARIEGICDVLQEIRDLRGSGDLPKHVQTVLIATAQVVNAVARRAIAPTEEHRRN